jgi:hypothetical protein
MKLAIEMGPIQPDTLKRTVEWVQFAEKARRQHGILGRSLVE